MQKITTIEQYKRIIELNPYKHMTNHYMFLNETQEYIDNGLLFYDDSGHSSALLLYLKHKQFYKLFLYTSETDKLSIPILDKPTVTEIIFIESKGEPLLADILRNSGFVHLILFKQYYVSHADLHLSNSNLGDYQIVYATEDQIPAILSILHNTFLDITNELPDELTLKKRVNEKCVLSVINPHGEVCGCNQWQRRNEMCLIKHTTIIPELRGIGLGEKLEVETFKKVNAKGYTCWVAEDNNIKQKMDAKHGYRFNGKYMLKLVLK